MDTIKSIKIVTKVILTAIAAQIGILELPVFLLLGLNITDYATAKTRDEKVSSSKEMKGAGNMVYLHHCWRYGLFVTK